MSYPTLIKSLENKDLTNALDVLRCILESNVLFENNLNKQGDELRTELYDNCVKLKGCQELCALLTSLSTNQEEMYSEYL